MLTEAITTLGKSEEWFWDSELRIVWNLIMERRRLDEIRMKNQAIYIASYVWGHEPDEEEEKEAETTGTTAPAVTEATTVAQ